MLKELSTVNIPRYLDVLERTYNEPLDKIYVRLRSLVAHGIRKALEENETLKEELLSLATTKRAPLYTHGRKTAPEDRPAPVIRFIQLASSQFPLDDGMGKLFLNINMKAYVEHTEPLIYIVFAKYSSGAAIASDSGELHKKDWMNSCNVPRELLYRYMCHLYHISDETALRILLKGLSLRRGGALARTEILDATGKTMGYELPM